MKIVTGKIVAGQVVVDGAPFEEGALVSVFAHETHETFELTTEQEEDLLLAIEQAERGEFIAGAELLKSFGDLLTNKRFDPFLGTFFQE